MNSAIWYTTRAAGITTYLLLFGVVALGLLLSTRRPRAGMALAYHLHRYLTWLTLAFLGLHVFILLADGFIHFGLLDVAVPFHAAYEPLWTGVGVVALYALLAVALTSVVQERLPRRLWRTIHLLSFPTFLAATAHGIMAGSDGREPWLLAIYAVCGLTVAGLLAWRLGLRLPSRDPGLRWATAMAGAVAVVALAAIAGRIATAPASAGTAGQALARADGVPILASMSEQLSGALQGGARGGPIEIRGALQGDLPASITLDLQPAGGRSRSGATARALSGSVEIDAPDGTPRFSGTASVRGGRLVIDADGMGAYQGVSLHLEGPLTQVDDSDVEGQIAGGMQRDATSSATGD